MTFEEFAAALVERYADSLGGDYATFLRRNLAAGEREVAAICVIEDAPNVTAEDVDELERFSADFDDVDGGICRRVIAKRRR